MSIESEWLNKLNDVLIQHIFNGFKNLYQEMNKQAERIRKTNGKGKTLLLFQLSLERIRNLPQYMIDQDYEVLKLRLNKLNITETAFNDIIKKSYLDYINKIVPALKGKQMEIPNGPKFVHMVYINAARAFWIKPILFYDKLTSVAIQQNHLQILDEIKANILKTIRDSIDYSNLSNQVFESKESSNPLDSRLKESSNPSDSRLKESSNLLDSRLKEDSVKPIFHADNALSTIPVSQSEHSDKLLTISNKQMILIDTTKESTKSLIHNKDNVLKQKPQGPVVTSDAIDHQLIDLSDNTIQSIRATKDNIGSSILPESRLNGSQNEHITNNLEKMGNVQQSTTNNSNVKKFIVTTNTANIPFKKSDELSVDISNNKDQSGVHNSLDIDQSLDENEPEQIKNSDRTVEVIKYKQVNTTKNSKRQKVKIKLKLQGKEQQLEKLLELLRKNV